MITRVPLSRVEPNPYQGRQQYQMTGLADRIYALRDELPDTSGLISIPTARLVGMEGVIDPAEFESVEDALASELNAFIELAEGHRRWKAFERLRNQNFKEYETLPVDVQFLDDQAMMDIAWSENADRADINSIERAAMIQKAINDFGYTQAEVGERWRLSQSAVSNLLRLLRLPGYAQQLVREGRITERHGRALLPLVALESPEDVYRRVLRLSGNDCAPVSEVESAVARHVETRTYPLEGVAWPLDWTPDDPRRVPGNGMMPACDGCPHSTKVGRNAVCTWRVCYELKGKTYNSEVVGPTKAEGYYHNYSRWETFEPRYFVACNTCGRHSAGAGEEHRWYRSAGLSICDRCWQGADLPEPEPQPAPDLPAPDGVVKLGAGVYSGPPDDDDGVEYLQHMPVRVLSTTQPEIADRPPVKLPAPESKPRELQIVIKVKPPSNGDGPLERETHASIGELYHGPSYLKSGQLRDVLAMVAGLLEEQLGVTIEPAVVEA